MPYGAIIAGLLSAAGPIAGGFLGQAKENPGDQVIPATDPSASFPLQASIFDSLAGSGFARPDLLLNAGPLNELFARIQSMQIDEKSKRRALIEIQRIASGGELTTQAEADALAFPLSGFDAPREIRFVKEMEGVLSRLGISPTDIPGYVERQQRYDKAIEPLIEEFGLIQPEVIRNRMKAQSDVSGILGGALGDGDSRIMRTLRDRLMMDREKALGEAEERTLLQGQFGGFNPSARLEQIGYQRDRLGTDVDFESTMQALALANQMNALLSPASAAAQAQAQLGINANLGALGIAAGQSQAANQLRGQIGVNNADSLANGIAGGFNSIGQGFMNQSILDAYRSAPTVDQD